MATDVAKADIAGDYTALSSAAKRGLRLFIGKAACVDCHSGPNLPWTDNGRFDDLGRTLTDAFNATGKFSDDPAIGIAKLAGIELTTT